MSLTIHTELGVIRMRLRPDAAPTTVAYISKLAQDGAYDNCTFYRSDFVIQCGLHGTGRKAPENLKVNETSGESPHSSLTHPPAPSPTHAKAPVRRAVGPRVSNTRGTAAIAHWDVPDCGNSEFFINLGTNAHLDEAYGGYCVFAQVEDDASFAIVDAIAAAVKSKSKVSVTRITCP